ncbi:uncharacterized membrane protein HdeD (DUF308 family) [Peribacillus simplex]|uniref:hypothetical protein n=1 Tax=Peribacillus TaxID=2675229 RepID=UPI000777B711|nr:hypothetical protein [Peribacillus simplex]AMM94706.1 hypothetical protein UP17_21370 [Peribacillus simplex]MDF9763430.1 uncharacterized membrane protein HdeD (DUF308 family) [Peribacillus simplex]MDW7618065.1 hypothetical protein [Peribacillus simplex]
MKNKALWILTFSGIVLISFGIFVTFPVANEIRSIFIRPDLVSIAIIFTGVFLTFSGVTSISSERFKTKAQKIEENDERNIKINQFAKSKAFDFMSILFGIGLLFLALLGYMNKVSFFFLIGLYFISYFYFLYQNWLIRKAI